MVAAHFQRLFTKTPKDFTFLYFSQISCVSFCPYKQQIKSTNAKIYFETITDYNNVFSLSGAHGMSSTVNGQRSSRNEARIFAS